MIPTRSERHGRRGGISDTNSAGEGRWFKAAVLKTVGYEGPGVDPSISAIFARALLDGGREVGRSVARAFARCEQEQSGSGCGRQHAITRCALTFRRRLTLAVVEPAPSRSKTNRRPRVRARVETSQRPFVIEGPSRGRRARRSFYTLVKRGSMTASLAACSAGS